MGPTPAGLEAEHALDLLRTMWRIRCFEERVAKLHHSLQVHGLVHLSIGSEGVAAGVCRQLRDDDALYSGHRAHGHALAKGAPMDRVMAELMGRSAGLCQGLGGSMHLVDTEHGLMGATGVVGGNLPMAAGDALAARLRGVRSRHGRVLRRRGRSGGPFRTRPSTSRRCGSCRSSSSARTTAWPSSRRARPTPRWPASSTSWRPTTSTGRRSRAPTLARYGRLSAAIWSGRAGKGPFLLECSTHRRSGHYEGDQQSYRDALADAEWAQLDPIARLEALAQQQGWIDEEAARGLTAEADAEVDRAVHFGRDSPPLTPEQAAELVYAT